ncbi:MAG TPA: ABC transporter permease [Ktedonobacteraceae bacterium]
MVSIARCGYATFIRNWIVTLRAYPWSFFISGLMGGVFTVALAYFTFHLLASGQLGHEFTSYAGTSDYMSYIILGTAILTFSVNIMLGISRSMISERREGTLESLLLAPAKRGPYFSGVTAQWALNSLVETAVMLLVTWPLGLNLSRINIETLMIAAPVALIGLFGMSTLLGAIMLATGDTYISQNTLFATMTLVCGFVFPPNYLPLPLQWLGAALPVSGALRLLRAALLNGTAPMVVMHDIVVYTLLGLVYAIAGLTLMRWAERRALEGAR